MYLISAMEKFESCFLPFRKESKCSILCNWF